MTRRLPVSPSPGPLEEYVVRFDDLFRARAQRDGFRRYLEGLLLPAERNKTLTALANTEPLDGAQRKEAQSLQWFLSESGWDPPEDPRASPRTLARRPFDRPGRGRSFGHRRARGPQVGQEDRPRGQAVAGQHRQDRERGGQLKQLVGGREDLPSSCLRALHPGASLRRWRAGG